MEVISQDIQHDEIQFEEDFVFALNLSSGKTWEEAEASAINWTEEAKNESPNKVRRVRRTRHSSDGFKDQTS